MRSADLGWVNISRIISGVSGPKFTNFLFNAGRTVDDNVVYCFCCRGTCGQSQKLLSFAPIFECFLPSQIIRSGAPQKLYPRYRPYLAAHIMWQSLIRLLPLTQKLSQLIRYIFSQFLTSL